MNKLSESNAHQLIASAMLNRCDRVAFVDVTNFECQFIKHPDDTQEHQWMASATDIVSYMKRLMNWGFVHPEDLANCRQRLNLFLNDSKYRHAFEDRNLRFRYRFGANYEWAELNIMTVAEDMPEKRLFYLSKVRGSHSSEAVKCVLEKYYKILHVNLNDGSFDLVRLTGEEINEQHKLPPTIYDWWLAFADDGNVHPDDVQRYLDFVERMRSNSEPVDTSRSCKLVYRRRQGHAWRWVLMELVPDGNCAPGSKEFMLYIQDVHDFLRLNTTNENNAQATGTESGKATPKAVEKKPEHGKTPEHGKKQASHKKMTPKHEKEAEEHEKKTAVVQEFEFASNPGLAEMMELFHKPASGIPLEYSDFTWSARYSIGVQSLDDAHKEFFAITQRLLHFVTKTEKDEWACKQGIKFLKQFTLQHFADEEDYMRSINYAETEAHEKEHAQMRDIIIPRLEKELHQENYSQESALRFIKVCFIWLRGHVLHTDMKLQKIREKAA